MKPAQLPLFSNNSSLISIPETAGLLKVSEASIRNWIKTGHLEVVRKRFILRASFEKFQENVVGQEKLTARANKSKLDSHDHQALQSAIEKMIISPLCNGKGIADYYEQSLSQSHRNLEGIYYTPDLICDSFFEVLPTNRENLIFFDPCCGTGNFLIAAVRAGIRPENIMGCDLDQTALSIARKRLSEISGKTSSSLLFHMDFLNPSNADLITSRKPDVIFTNPPWGKKIDSHERGILATNLFCKKSLDSSGLFILACLRTVRSGGYYGMVLPEAFFNVSAFEQVRSEVLKDELIKITDYGRAFPSLLTKAVGFTSRRNHLSTKSLVRCITSQEQINRNQVSFIQNPSKILNYWSSASDVATLDYIFKQPHITLVGNAEWALGIVTGNNKRHLSNQPQDGFVPVYKGSDINHRYLNAPSNYISKNMSKFQQVAPIELYHAPEKIIYRFISSKLIFYHDTKQSIILNSANLLIPNRDFPISMKILAEYLSCDFVNWLHKNIFASHKVLRSNIERLPIFVDVLKDATTFDERILLKAIGIEREGDGSYRIKK